MAAKLVRKKAGFESIELFKDQIIGAGAFGAVCHAQCDHLPCAAKILHPTIFSIGGQHKNALQFEQECKFIRTVQHPNIVQYLGVHYDDITGQPVLLMEMMDENLTYFLESSPDEVPYHLQVNFCRDIVLALSFLHSNDIIHRNLSGNNVLLICKARAKVSDFGMARLGSFNPKRSFIARIMSPTTHPYIPPEGLRNNPNYDAKIDCFSFGVVAIQIMTRKFPSLPDHNKPPDSENADGVLSYMIVSEVERRKDDISEINPNHPLLQIALPCLSNDSTQRPSTEKLYKKIKKLQESDKYCKSMSDSEKSHTSSKGASSEMRSNQPMSGEDADASVPSQEQTVSSTMKASDSHITEEQVEYHDGPIDGAEHPEAQDVIIIAAEVHTTEDETLPEQSSPSEKSNQHPCNHHDHYQKSLKASGFDKDEEILGEFVQKSQGIKPASSSKEFIIPSSNGVDKNGDQPLHEIDEHIEDKEISKSVQNESTEGHCDSPQHKNGAEEELRSKEESGHIIQTAVAIDAKREGSENTVQGSGDEDVQQEMQENLSENDDMNKKEERKPVQNVDTVENNLQEIKHDDASVTEQRREENKRKDAEQPELEGKHDNITLSVTQKPKQESKQGGIVESELESKHSVSISQQSKQESKKDESEIESKRDNADPQKQESKPEDVQPDRESKAKEGKEVQTHSGAEMVNNSSEIMVLSQATDSDEGATKPEITSEEGKKRKRKFTVFSRRKEPKSKKDIKERQKENDKTEGKGSKTYGGGKKLIPPKKEKEKGKKKLTPKADKHKQKQKKKERKKNRKEMRTVMLGLDSSGKTTILYRMKLGQCVTTIPTRGFNVETVKYNKIKFCIWDVGGQDKIRPLWRHYLSGTDGFVFIVDSSDRDRFDDAIEEFHSVVQEEEMKDAIILVLANKQDLPDVMNVAEIEEKMGLHKLSDRKWFIQPTCGASGEGLFEGLEWLRSQHLGEEYSPAMADTLT